MTKDLTELWKKGELEINNNYYLRFADGTEEIQLYIGGFLMRADNEVVEVLAEVPDYIEWKNYVNGYCEEHEYNLKLQDENAKLKETIKRTKANGNYPSRVSAYKSRIATLCEENQQLKELLKECRKALNKAKGDTVWYPVEIDHVITKIDEVLNANVR